MYEGEGAAEAPWLHSKQVLELGHAHVTRRARGVAAHQRLRQVGDHEAKLDHAQQNLGQEQQEEWS